MIIHAAFRVTSHVYCSAHYLLCGALPATFILEKTMLYVTLYTSVTIKVNP